MYREKKKTKYNKFIILCDFNKISVNNSLKEYVVGIFFLKRVSCWDFFFLRYASFLKVKVTRKNMYTF